MAASKTFETAFKIGAKFTGGPAFAAANRAIDQTERNARMTTGAFAKLGSTIRSVGKIGAGVFAGTMPTGAVNRGITAVKAWARESLDAGVEVLNVHESLRSSIEKNPRFFDRKKSTRTVEEQTQALIKQAEVMEKTGHDAETLQTLYAKIFASGTKDMPSILSPKQVEENASALSDMLSKVEGLRPGFEGASEAGEMLTKAIRGGSPELLKRLDAGKEEIKAFRKLTSEAERRLFILKQIAKLQGETQRIFITPAGIMAQAETQRGNIFESLGNLDPQKAKKLGEAYRELWINLGKIVDEKVIDKLTSAFDKLAKFMDEHSEGIAKAIDSMFKGFDWLLDNYKAVSIGIGAITAAIVAMNAAMLLNPIGLTVLALAGLGIAIYQVASNWDYLKAKAIEIWDAIKLKWMVISAQFRGIWDEALLNFEVNVIGQIIKLWDKVPEGIKAALANVGQIITDIFKPPFDWIMRQLGIIAQAFGQVVPSTLPYGKAPGTFRSWDQPLPSQQWQSAPPPPVPSASSRAWTPGPSVPPPPPESAMNVPVPPAVLPVAGRQSAPYQAQSEAYERAIADLGSEAAINEGVRKAQAYTEGQKHRLTPKGGIPPWQGETPSTWQEKLFEKGSAPSVIPGGEETSIKGAIRSMNMRQKTGGQQPVNVTSSPVINIHGVPAENVQAIASEVKKAMRDPINTLLDQLKQARAAEARLGYV